MKLFRTLRKRLLENLASRRKQKGKALGLPECRQIDRNLAKVASATFDDLSSILVDEIFQHVDHRKLVCMCRVYVSSEWFATIVREFAPFMRHIAVELGALPPIPTQTTVLSGESRLLFPKNTSLVLMFKARIGDKWNYADGFFKTDAQLCGLWDSYEEQASRNGRTERISTIIYANIELSSSIFLHSAVFRADVRTVLYEVHVLVDIVEIFEILPPEKSDDWTLCEGINHPGKMAITIWTSGHFQLAEEDVTLMKRFSYPRYGRKITPNIPAIVFAVGHADALGDSRRKELADILEHPSFPSQKLDLIRQLVQTFDPEREEIVEEYVRGNTTSFLSLARPMVQILLRHFFIKNAPRDYHTTYTLSNIDMFIPAEEPELDE